MTFYQELQLSSAGSKQLIKSTKDKKEKFRHILIYNFKVYLVMIFCVAVVTLFTKFTGSNNSVVGVTVLLAVLVLRQADFGIRTTHGLLSIAGIYLILMAGPRFTNTLTPVPAFFVNVICILLLMILGCHNVIIGYCRIKHKGRPQPFPCRFFHKIGLTNLVILYMSGNGKDRYNEIKYGRTGRNRT